MTVSRILSVLLIGTMLTPAAAFAKPRISHEDDPFADSPVVTDHELSKMRGGFVSLGGLTIDFALNTRVLVDGVIESNVSLSSQQLSNLVPADLQRVIQIGANNASAALDELQHNPALLTVIQNSQDDRVIQTLSTLDVTVNDFDSFRSQQVENTINVEAVNFLP